MTDCIVVGAGPAGLMAAIFASQNGAKVRLLDTNGFPGKKLNITGKGRCNLTNDCTRDEFLENVPTNGRFLFSAYEALPPQEVMRLFNSWGLPLKVERGRRVFPVSDAARDVTDTLYRQLTARQIRVERVYVTGLWLKDGALSGVRTTQGTCAAPRVIIATGGLSYPRTGSTGDGYALAKEAGHTVTALRPSLVPLLSTDACCAAMQGLALKNVTLTLLGNGTPLFSQLGELLFTHEGVSGPLVLSASAHMRKEADYRLVLDMKPALSKEQLEARVLRDFGAAPNKDLGNLLGGLLPRLLIPVMLARACIPSYTKAHSVTRVQREALLSHIKAFTLDITGFAPIDTAVVTSGGVQVKEIDPKTMGSKRLAGLYFAGEVLDVDGYTGGYNLQIAWSTGAVAGSAAAQIRR